MDKKLPAPPSPGALARGHLGALLAHRGCKGCLHRCAVEQRARPHATRSPAGYELAKDTG